MKRSSPYPRLTKSYQGKFPFKIGTTSFIYPDHYIPNVKMLGPFMDEVELLLFESTQFEFLFSKPVVAELSRLSNKFKLSFNVHLPTDVSISHNERIHRQQAVDTLVSVIDRIAPLNPASLTLHIPYNEDSFKRDKLSGWRDRVRRNLEKLLNTGIRGDVIAVETLDYPFEIVADIVAALNLSICMDMGHLINHGYDPMEMFETFRAKIKIIHLHGVENRRDHLALDRLPAKFIEPVFSLMRKFNGSVSLEVFSYADLTASLEFLETIFYAGS
jgi:sugar phosphate isomerase/epimerase